MRFRLVEVRMDLSEDEYIEKVKNSDGDKKDEALKNLLNFWEHNGYPGIYKLANDANNGIREILLDSMNRAGYDKESNKFLQYTLNNYKSIDKKYEVNLSILQKLIDFGLIRYGESNLENPDCSWLGDDDLLGRDRDDFEYAVKILNIANDKSLAKNYFKSTENISVEDLFDKGKLKPSGLKSKGGDGTIWEQVENWAKEYGEVEKEDSEKKNRKKKLSLNQLFKRNGVEDTREKISFLESALKKEKILNDSQIDLLINKYMSVMTKSELENFFDETIFLSFDDGEISSVIQREFEL